MKIARISMLTIVLLWLLSGCSWLSTPDITNTPSPTATPLPSPEPSLTPTPTPLPGVTTLTLWVPDFLNPYDESTGAALLFEQLTAFSVIQPDVQVEVIVKKSTGTGGLYNLLSTASGAAPDVLPDLIILNQYDLQRAIDGGYVQPLEDTALQKLDFFPFARALQPGITTTYGIPFVALADHTVYRTGVSATPPFTWTDVLTYGYSLLLPAVPADGLADDALLAAYLGAGGHIVDEEGEAKLDRDTLEQLYGFIVDMMNLNLINPDRVLLLPDATASWEMYQQGVGRVSAVPAGLYWTDPPPGSAPGWIPTPSGDPIAIAHTWSMALVTRDPFRQEAARQLMQWLTAPEQVAAFTRATYVLPTRYHAIELWGLLPEETAFLEKLLDNAAPNPPPAVGVPVRRALQAGLTVLLSHEVDTPEAAAIHALNNLRQ